MQSDLPHVTPASDVLLSYCSPEAKINILARIALADLHRTACSARRAIGQLTRYRPAN